MSDYTLPVPLSTPSLDVSGRVIVITGGTQGLGLEIAHQLAQNGAKGLVLVSRSANKADAAIEALTATSTATGATSTVTVKFVRADLSKAADAISVIPQAAEAMKDIGPITGVVNAAAVTFRGNLMTTTADSFDMQFAINVRAPFLITQGAAKHMEEHGVPKGQGSIVNICSVAAKGGAPFIMGYSCAKAALVTLTKNNAAELAPKGIRVNGVNMGWCLTENEDKLQSEQSGDARWFEGADQGVPLGRILRPADVASSVNFLLSGASTMMTGSVLDLHPEFPCGMLSLLAEDSQER
jgi:NAD(P)-dependent dehydrogenase (short-subunit alcohol dehydrogenase family)